MKKYILTIAVLLTLCFLPSLVYSDAITGPQALPSRWWKIGDGLKGDSTDETVALQAILNLTAVRTGYLRLEGGVYLLRDSIVVPEGVTLEGNHAKLQFEISGETKALCLESNTKVSGFVIDVDSVSAITGDGSYGAPICIGNYASGVGFSNIVIKNLTIYGERINGNGIFISGHSHNIEIENIRFPQPDSMGRAIAMHWGGVELTDTTYHPYNIKISNIYIGSILHESTENGGITLSGAYNVEIENVIIDSCYYQGVCVFIGDKGFEYAHDIDSVAFGKGVILRNIQVTYSNKSGIRLVGIPSFAIDSSFTDTIYAMNILVENCHVSGDNDTLTTGGGFQIEACKSVQINNCTAEKFRVGAHVSFSCDGISITNSQFYNNNGAGIVVRKPSGGLPSFTPPRNVFIENNIVYQNANDMGSSPTVIDRSGIVVSTGAQVTIANNVIGRHPETQTIGIRLDSDVDSCYIVGNHIAATDTTVAAASIGYSIGSSTDNEVQMIRAFLNNTIDTVSACDTVNEFYYTGLNPIPFLVTGHGQRYFTGSAAPPEADSAMYGHGDIIFDDYLTTVTKMGWYYYGSGNWRPFGNWEIGHKTLVAQSPQDGEVVTYAIDGDSVYWGPAGTGGADADSIRGTPVSQVAPTDNYIMIYDAALDTIMWEVETGGAGEANVLSDTGTYNETEGFGLAGGKTGVALKVKGLIEGSGVTIAKSGDSALSIAASGAGLTYWTESDDNDTSVFTATAPNTWVGLNDNLTMQGNDIIGVTTIAGQDSLGVIDQNGDTLWIGYRSRLNIIRAVSLSATSSPGRVILGNSDDSIYIAGFGYTAMANDPLYRIVDRSTLHDTADVLRGEMSGSGFWAFRDSTTIVYVNDSTGDTILFLQDTTGFQGIRMGGSIIGVESLVVTTAITVPANSIDDDELDEGAQYTWTSDHIWAGGEHTFMTTVWIDDGAGDSPTLFFRDQDNQDFQIAKSDDGHSTLYNTEGEIRFHASYVVDDYIYFDTFAADVPMISTGGDCDLVINASGGDISFGDENLATTGYLGADSLTVAHWVSGGVYLGNDTLKGVDVLVADTFVVDGDVIKDFTGTNLSVTDGVLNAAGGGDGLDSGEVMVIIRDTTYGDSSLIAGVVRDTGAILYQPLEATLTDIADGTINENLVNTANPWADDEVADDVTAGTADSADEVTDQTIDGNDVDSTAENFVFNDPYKGTSAVGDSVLTTRKELGDSSTAIRGDFPGGLGEQLVKGDHVDSTSENFVFNDPYKGTSAIGDSVLTTRKELGDTSAAVRGDFPTGLTDQGVKGDHVDSTAENFVFVAAYEGTSAEADSQYSTHNWVRVEVEDSLNEYSLTSAIASLYPDTAETVDTAQALDNIVLSKIRDTVMAVLDTIWFGMTIDNPDGLTKDSVMVLAVEAEWAPNGITLLSVGIKTWAVTTYSVVFIEFTEPGDGGVESAIETVATSTSREAEDDGTLTDADIAAGSIIVVDLPTTDIDQVMVWGTFTVD